MKRQVGWYDAKSGCVIDMIQKSSIVQRGRYSTPVFVEEDAAAAAVDEDKRTTIALAAADGDKRKAAKSLGVSMRTLQRRVTIRTRRND